MPPLNQWKQPEDRWILSCDGGGIRGFITLHALAALERYFQKSCLELFDMFSGTSAGAIIAGSLASGRLSVAQLIDLYRTQRHEVFSRNVWSYPFYRLAIKYRKAPVHRLLCAKLANITLAECPRDILITATDTVRSETTFFSSFKHPHPPLRPSYSYGLYASLPLRHVIEASFSAPTYFPPHGRFIDGGVGVHNNPSYMAAVEALRYSFPNNVPPENRRYQAGKIVLFSFGTGAESNHMRPGEAMNKWNINWVDYVIGEGMDQANVQQSYVMHEELDAREGSSVFYRYQILLRDDQVTRQGLERLLGEAIPGDFSLRGIALDSIDEKTFGFLDRLGLAFGVYLENNNFFLRDVPVSETRSLNAKPRGHLEEYGHKTPSKAELERYLEEIRAEFDEQDEKYGRCGS